MIHGGQLDPWAGPVLQTGSCWVLCVGKARTRMATGRGRGKEISSGHEEAPSATRKKYFKIQHRILFLPLWHPGINVLYFPFLLPTSTTAAYCSPNVSVSLERLLPMVP